MNILIIGPAYPYRGGIAMFSERLAKALTEQGCDTHICTFTLQYPAFLFPGKTQFSDDPAPTDLSITRAINAMNPINWWLVGNELKKQKADLVIIKFWLPYLAPCLGTLARIIKKNKHTRIIGLLHNVKPHEKRPGDHQFTNYFLQACDGFVSMSRAVKEDVKDFTHNPHSRYMPHPIYDNFGQLVPKNEARKWLNIQADKKTLLFFGLIRRYKGLDILLRAMADERIEQMDVQLIVAGEYYEDKSYYDQLIAELGIESAIISKPEFIPNDAVKYYFCAADLVAQPYRTATQSGISQMAYHFERPMLVSNVGGLPEIVPDGVAGYVTEPTPTAVADAIVQFYKEDKEAEFSKNVAVLKKQFSWDVFSKGVLELYEELEDIVKL